MLNFINRKKAGILFVAICVLICSLSCWIGVFAPTYTAEEIADAATYDSYYAGLNESLTGNAFRTELADLITDTHTTLTSYSGLSSVFKNSDKDPNKSGNIILFYTGTSKSFNGSFGSSVGAVNREHVWPKMAGKAFPESTLCGSDAHHLRPCDFTINGTRSNNGFGEVPQTSGNIVSENGSKSYKNLCYLSGGVFYPGEGYRGATARILMYVQTRWGDDYNLSFVLGQSNDSNGKTIGDIEDLFKWHIEEPPTEEEIARNEAVYKIQGNRNPFIDHPEYAEMIYCHDGKNYNDELQTVVDTYGSYVDGTAGGNDKTPLQYLTITPTSADLAVGETTTLRVNSYPSSASNSVIWSSSNTNVASVTNGGIVTGISTGSANITATSTEDSSIKATIAVTIKAVSAISLTGAPIKTVYNSGEKFTPAGITVTATYSDGSTGNLDVTKCAWLDGTTRSETLSVGTTSVICKYGTIEQTVATPITVKESVTQTLKITRDAFSGSGKYNWHPWTVGSVSGYGYMYPGTTDSIQMNTTNGDNRLAQYLYNTTPLSGGIQSITIKIDGDSTKNWEIRTSTTPFESADGKATGGTVRGTLTSSSSGGTLNIGTTDQYFAITYDATLVVKIIEITIVYGSSHSHTPGDWVIDSNPTCNTTGSKHTVCTECGDIVDVEVIPTTNHTYGNWTTDSTGTETRTCTVCGHVDERSTVDGEKIDQFKEFVDDAKEATMENKLSAIKTALEFYKSLDEAQKEDASEYYALLKNIINDYNTTANVINSDSQKATSDAIMLFAGSISVLAIAAYFLLKA